MGARTFQRGLGLLLLGWSSAACDNGVVELTLLSAAGRSADAGEEAGKSGGGGGGASGAAGDVRGDMGGPPRQPTNFCDWPWEVEQEDALLQTLSEALEAGRYCPHVAPLRRPLSVDLDLVWQARATVCLNVADRSWFRLSRGPGSPTVYTWSIVDTASLEDAKKALLNSERESLCREAEQNPFRRVGVAHAYESWSIFLAPAAPEDMQKP